MTHDDSPTVEILDVTPSMAEQWLSRNPVNRNMRRAVVDAYARDMTAGSWLLNGETIKIDRDGNLRDGQHRLAGVVQSGTTVPSIVVSGLDPNVTATVDAGTKRTYSDVLRIAGEQNTATLAAVTRRALLWDRGYRTKIGSVYPTPSELTDFLATQPTLRVAAEFAQRLSTKALVPASIFGLAYWLSQPTTPTTRRGSCPASQTATGCPVRTPSRPTATASSGCASAAAASTKPKRSRS